MTDVPNLSSLPRFTISVILSYLQLPPPPPNDIIQGHEDVQLEKSPLPLLILPPHNRDAIALLLTSKLFTYAILPLFRVPKTVARTYHSCSKNGTNSMNNDGIVSMVEKYRFMVLPIQDPRTLLDRLNTRRLRERIVWSNRMKKKKRQSLEPRDEDDANMNFHEMMRHSDIMSCYEYGRTIEELAFEEWIMMQIHHADAPYENGTQELESNSCKRWRVWPANLELLQFLDVFDTVQSKDSNLKRNREKRNIPRSSLSFEEGAERILPMGVTLLASYPRSGNTLLRTLLERITSVVTGSDTGPDRTLSKSLALEHNLVGEGLVGREERTRQLSNTNTSISSRNVLLYQSAFDPLVQIVKTHFPERKGWKPLTGNRVLLLIRNPYDAIDSYWNLCCTNTHTRTLDESVYERYAQKFEDLSKHEIQIWCDFHYYWMDRCEKEGVPILIVRYEDLVLDTEAEMRRIMAFVLNVKDGTLDSFWEWRIRHAVSNHLRRSNSLPVNDQTSTLGSYKPRSSNGGLPSIGKSVRKGRFSEGILLHMHEIAVSLALERKQKYLNITPVPNIDSQQYNVTLLQRFGYDIYTHKFPESFKRLDDLPLHGEIGQGCGTVTINKTSEIRRKDDPFGRAMTLWRRGETHNDTVPFLTVSR